MGAPSSAPTPPPLAFRRPCKKGYPARGGGAGTRRTFVAHLVLAVLAFALVSSVGAGVALHQAGFGETLVAPNNGGGCGHDDKETNEKNETGGRDENGGHNETRGQKETGGGNENAAHAPTPGPGGSPGQNG